LFSFLRLATIRRVAPQPAFIETKKIMDGDTVKDILNSRLHVMESYARSVIKPVHACELKAATEHRQILRGADRDLIRVDHLLDEAARLRVAAALAVSESLQTVYELRNELQGIWQRAGASQEALLLALQDWCRQAEATGIDCLQEFSIRLHGYQLKPFRG
jgi:stearoyl-CoA desaturase (delta-9 desaturase)